MFFKTENDVFVGVERERVIFKYENSASNNPKPTCVR